MSAKNFLIIPISPALPAWIVPRGEAKMWASIDNHLSMCHEYHDAYMIISEKADPELFKLLSASQGN